MWQLLLVPSHSWACFQKDKEQNTINNLLKRYWNWRNLWGGEKKNWDEYLFSMHHYCSKFQWWMAGSLINCLLILSHHWAMEIFLPKGKDLLWQLAQEAVAFWASQQQILTKSHHILSSTINVVFLFPEGGYFLLFKGIEDSLYVILKEMLRAPNCWDWHLTSYSLSGQKRNWDIWTFH